MDGSALVFTYRLAAPCFRDVLLNVTPDVMHLGLPETLSYPGV